MTTKPSDELLEILRRDLHGFIHLFFLELNPGATFLDNWHIAAIAAALERVRTGACRRLIICMPPRSLKSHCVSIAFVAWLLGHNPAEQIISVSYAQDLADKLARDCRTLMSKPIYKAMFSTRLSPSRQAVSEFETTQQGFRLSTSVGGPLTGRGANFILIDDALKPEEATSDPMRERVNDWYANTLYSRLNDKNTGAIVLVMQRLHEDDLAGRLLSHGGWELLSFPAIAERDEEFRWATPYGERRHGRRVGDVLHPARESRETLASIRRTLGSYVFAGQYQQTPAPHGGGLVKPEWFRRYRDHERPTTFDYILQSWDTANKPGELANFSVCTTWGIKGQKTYLLDVFRQRIGYLDLKLCVKARAQTFNAKVVLIEDKASGTQLIEDLLGDGVRGVTRYKPEGDKILRMSVQTAAIEAGEVYVPHAASWLDDYLHEISTFPKGRFSDQVDSTSQALDWIKQLRNNGVEAYLNYYKRLAEGPPSPPLGPCRPMIAPSGTTWSRLNDGRLLTKGPDGLFQVPLDLVSHMISAGWRLADERKRQ
jgi:predicted phage terminase large subunit-like protein